MITANVHNATGIRARLSAGVEHSWLQFIFVGTELADLSVFLPIQLAPRRILLEELRDDVAAAIEETQHAIVEENHRALSSLVSDAAQAVEEIGEDELERSLTPPVATFPRPVAGPPELVVQPSQLAEANAIPEYNDHRDVDVAANVSWEQGDLVLVAGWQYVVTAEGALEALDGNDPRLIELPEPRDTEGEAIVRSLERENAYFTRTGGWDPRGDGP